MADETKKAGNSLGDRIRGLREAMGMTQVQLAEFFETTETTVSRWENNSNLPKSSLLVRMQELAQEHNYLNEFIGIDERARFADLLNGRNLTIEPGVTALLDIQIENEMDGLAGCLQVIGKYCVPPLRISSVEAEATPEHSTLLALVNMPDPPKALHRMVDEIRGVDGVASCEGTATIQGILEERWKSGDKEGTQRWRESTQHRWEERHPRKEIDPASSHLARTGRTREPE